jgi:hypothetical protein
MTNYPWPIIHDQLSMTNYPWPIIHIHTYTYIYIYIEGARSSIAFSGTYADPSKIILLVTPRLRERQPTSKLPTHQKNSLRGSLRGQSCESWRSQTGPPRTQGSRVWEFSDAVNYNRKPIIVPCFQGSRVPDAENYNWQTILVPWTQGSRALRWCKLQ